MYSTILKAYLMLGLPTLRTPTATKLEALASKQPTRSTKSARPKPCCHKPKEVSRRLIAPEYSARPGAAQFWRCPMSWELVSYLQQGF